MSAPLLDVARPAKSFRRGGRHVAALDDVSSRSGARRDAGAGRPVGQRQVDAGAHRHAARRAGCRHASASTASTCSALRGEALRRLRPRFQMVFQDPLAAFNPRATVGARARRSAAHPRPRRPRRAARAPSPPARTRRPDRRLPARAHPRDLRRPAPARRHRPRHRHPAGADRARRGGVGARRHRCAPASSTLLGDLQRDERHRLSLHLARPRRGSRLRRTASPSWTRPHRRDRRRAAAIVAAPQSAIGKALVAAMPRLLARRRHAE